MDKPIERLRNCTCPRCGKRCDAATSYDLQRNIPSDGDITVCWYCGGIGRYRINDEADFNIIAISDEELTQMALEDPNTVKMVIDISNMVKEHHAKS